MKAKKHLLFIVGVCLVVAFAMISHRPASAADQVTLKAVAFLPTTTHQTKFFIGFIDEVQKRSEGKLKIDFLGGPEVIGSREQVDALKSGVVQMAMIPPSYFAKQAPAISAKYLDPHPLEQRKNGFYDIMVELTEKTGMRYLGEINPGEGMYLFTSFEVKNPRTDFKGKKIRIVTTYDHFIEALGAAGVVVPRMDIYTGMERGVIDGFFANAVQILQFGLDEVVKYLVHPIMWPGGVWINLNLDTWKKLPKDIQTLLLDTIVEKEREWEALYDQMDKEAIVKLREKGVKEIKFSPEDEKWFVDLAQTTEWGDIIKAAPVYGKRLRKIVLGY